MTGTASALGAPSALAIGLFFCFVALTLAITWWAARRTKSTEDFYAAGRSVTAGQNGLALAGDYMSAASFLGIAGLVAFNGFDGLMYSVGWLVGWRRSGLRGGLPGRGSGLRRLLGPRRGRLLRGGGRGRRTAPVAEVRRPLRTHARGILVVLLLHLLHEPLVGSEVG